MKNLKNTILFSGGGTLGSVMPLVGLFEDLEKKYPSYSFVWIGTKTGPEKEFLGKYNIKFFGINSGKLRRYFDIKNLVDLFNIKIGFFQSLKILIENRPKVVLTSGGFVSVPLAIAAWILKIPVYIHQQDFEVGLANRIMARFATKITVTLDESVENYKKHNKKIVKTGNFVKKSLFDFNYHKAKELFSIKTSKPILLVLGGGTGSVFMNRLIEENIDEILKHYEVIHSTGIAKNEITTVREEYHVYEILKDEIGDALNLADLVITRAGFSTLTEISALSKPAIIIPLPGHQEKNANLFIDKAIVLNQNNFNTHKFLESLKFLSENVELRKEMGSKIGDVIEIGNEKMINILEEEL